MAHITRGRFSRVATATSRAVKSVGAFLVAARAGCLAASSAARRVCTLAGRSGYGPGRPPAAVAAATVVATATAIPAVAAPSAVVAVPVTGCGSIMGAGSRMGVKRDAATWVREGGVRVRERGGGEKWGREVRERSGGEGG